jgi:hypothetical protein
VVLAARLVEADDAAEAGRDVRRIARDAGIRLDGRQEALIDRMRNDTGPLGELRYLYVGASDFDLDLAYYRDVLGAEVVWHFEEFGARVAAFRVASGPLLLIADHRPAPSCLPVFGVADLDATVSALRARGWKESPVRSASPTVRAFCSATAAATSSRCSETSVRTCCPARADVEGPRSPCYPARPLSAWGCSSVWESA